VLTGYWAAAQCIVYTGRLAKPSLQHFRFPPGGRAQWPEAYTLNVCYRRDGGGCDSPLAVNWHT
jgi:hypothetical protein